MEPERKIKDAKLNEHDIDLNWGNPNWNQVLSDQDQHTNNKLKNLTSLKQIGFSCLPQRQICKIMNFTNTKDEDTSDKGGKQNQLPFIWWIHCMLLYPNPKNKHK